MDLIIDLEYAKQILGRYDNAKIIGIEQVDINRKYIERENLLGYDILDGKREYSLISNFGNDIEIINNLIEKNGLIKFLHSANKVHHFLKEKFKEDPHIINCHIWAIYMVHL